MEPIKIEDRAIKKAIELGQQYIQVDTRKFLLMEVQDTEGGYLVTDAEEEKLLRTALEKPNPTLTKDEINKMLGPDS